MYEYSPLQLSTLATPLRSIQNLQMRFLRKYTRWCCNTGDFQAFAACTRVRIGNGVETNLPVTVQINGLWELDVITPYFVIRKHVHRCIARQRDIEIHSAHVERLMRITHKQQIQEIKFISEADAQELNLLGYPNHFTRYCTFLALPRFFKIF